MGGEWQGFVAGACLLVVLLAAADRGLYFLIRRRHRARAALVDTLSSCPDCGNPDCDRLERLRVDSAGSTLTAKCPNCGERAMKYRIVRDETAGDE